MTMISSTAFRVASRRVVGRSLQQRGFSSATAAFTKSNTSSKALMATAGFAAAVVALQQQEESSKTYNFFGKSSAQLVKETEDKFGTYWPRNILILL